MMMAFGIAVVFAALALQILDKYRSSQKDKKMNPPTPPTEVEQRRELEMDNLSDRETADPQAALLRRGAPSCSEGN